MLPHYSWLDAVWIFSMSRGCFSDFFFFTFQLSLYVHETCQQMDTNVHLIYFILVQFYSSCQNILHSQHLFIHFAIAPNISIVYSCDGVFPCRFLCWSVSRLFVASATLFHSKRNSIKLFLFNFRGIILFRFRWDLNCKFSGVCIMDPLSFFFKKTLIFEIMAHLTKPGIFLCQIYDFNEKLNW